jgi:ParB family chromosome partitioning protein
MPDEQGSLVESLDGAIAVHREQQDSANVQPPASTGLVHLSVAEIDDNPFQPRRDFSGSEIASLAESLKEHDMLQPVLVRRVGERYQLISGERRLRAALQAGWDKVPAQIREADDRLVAELAIVENLHRKDLNPIEKAMSFKRYLDQHGCSQEDLARRLSIDRSTIANLMRLLELPEVVLDALRRGDVSAGHARALLPLGDEALQIDFCERIRNEGLSVRAIETMVQDKISEDDSPIAGVIGGGEKKRKRARNDQVAALEQELRTALGAKVEIQQATRGRGRIVIHFSNHDEFERLHSALTDSRNCGASEVA